MKAGADLEQARHPPIELHVAARRRRDPRKNFEQRALPGAVRADDAHDFARRDLEADVPQRPESSAVFLSGEPPEPAQGRGKELPQRVAKVRRPRGPANRVTLAERREP